MKNLHGETHGSNQMRKLVIMSSDINDVTGHNEESIKRYIKCLRYSN